MGLIRLFVLCFLMLSLVLAENDNNEFDDDTVVIEAAPVEAKTKTRTSRQVLIRSPAYPPFLFNQFGQLGTSPLVTGSCFTSKNVLGRCMSFRQCYPYFKLPELNNWDTWVFGMYDTCSYYTQQGRQMFGVCCVNPQGKPDTEEEPQTEAPVKHEEITSSTSAKPPSGEGESGKSPQYPNIPNWPPPIPTHPPDHTIPPLPTHPPSPGYPGLPAAPTTPATTMKPAWPPAPTTTKRPSWPGAPTTSRPPSWPGVPIQPTHPPTAESPSLPGASCGAKNGYQDQERIVGGHNADLGEWPWIAALFNGGRQFCGGSLIDDIHILSAAHCVAHMSSWDVARLTVRLADHNIQTNSETRHIEKKVKRVVRHRGFDSRTLYNDIAILTLESPVQFSKQVRPICLPSPGSSYDGQTATVIGWGSLRESGPQPAVLQEVNIPIWSNNDCRNKYGPAAPGGIVDHMLCAGQASRDSCSGDSGGPLMVNNGRWTQVGVVSWGIGCGKGQYPGVYTRVEKFLTWINKNLK